MAFNISYVYRAIDQFSAPAAAIARSVTNIKEKIESSRASMEKFGTSMRNTGAKMSGFLTLPIAMLAKHAIIASAQIETMQMSFDVILKSAEKGHALMKSLKELTLKTPYLLPALGDSARMLLSAGVAVEDVDAHIMKLGNIAAGANMPLENMVAIFAKVRNQGRAMGREINQLNKTPIRSILSNMFTDTKTGKAITQIELSKMISKGMITPEIFNAAINKMTSRTGIYYNKMAGMMDTMAGAWSNVQHAAFLANATIGDIIVDVFDLKNKLVTLSEWLISASNRFKEWAAVHPILTKIIFYAIALVAILGPLLMMIGLMSIGFGILATPIGLVAAGIVAITAALLTFKPIADVVYLAFELTRLASERLYLSLAKIGNYLSDLMPKFEWFSKIKGQFSAIGNFFGPHESIGGYADYLSKQDIQGWNPTVNAKNDSTLNGTITVKADPGTSVVSTTSTGNGNNVSLGQNMGGDY